MAGILNTKENGMLTAAEHKKAFELLTRGKKHAVVPEALITFLYDNDFVPPSKNLAYADLKSVSPDGTVVLEACPNLKFSMSYIELLH